jgi:hypothetical protein
VCHIVSCCLPNPGWDFELINVSPNHGANITNNIATNVTMPTALSPPQQNSKNFINIPAKQNFNHLYPPPGAEVL